MSTKEVLKAGYNLSMIAKSFVEEKYFTREDQNVAEERFNDDSLFEGPSDSEDNNIPSNNCNCFPKHEIAVIMKKNTYFHVFRF